jgi:hypothetical protein
MKIANAASAFPPHVYDQSTITAALRDQLSAKLGPRILLGINFNALVI